MRNSFGMPAVHLMRKRFLLAVAVVGITTSVAPVKAATTSLGTFIFDIAPVPGAFGGRLVADVLTEDDPVTNPVANNG